MVTAAASFQGMLLSNSLQRAEIIFSRFKEFSAKDNSFNPIIGSVIRCAI